MCSEPPMAYLQVAQAPERGRGMTHMQMNLCRDVGT
jgi:hypothetical protein